MNQDIKNLLTENSLKRIHEVFNVTDEPIDRLIKTIAEISVKSTVVVLEEYEKLSESR